MKKTILITIISIIFLFIGVVVYYSSIQIKEEQEEIKVEERQEERQEDFACGDSITFT